MKVIWLFLFSESTILFQISLEQLDNCSFFFKCTPLSKFKTAGIAKWKKLLLILVLNISKCFLEAMEFLFESLCVISCIPRQFQLQKITAQSNGIVQACCFITFFLFSSTCLHLIHLLLVPLRVSI